jgi:chemotaxis methyl-accepting protein methylase
LKGNDFCISDIIDEVYDMKPICRPVLLYVDTEAYPHITKYLDEILNEYKIIVVVHDDQHIANEYNMQVIDEKLNLYYLEGKKNGI